MNLELAQHLTEQVWGQGFAQPTFSTRFNVEDQRVVGQKHLKLKLRKQEAKIGADGPEKSAKPDVLVKLSNNIKILRNITILT